MRIITDAQYIKNEEEKNQTVFCKIDGKECSVPMDIANSDYAEILKQVADSDLTIKDAD
tara:strand:+ start:3682 stop:3858 length:177 start_codon:yes stop_codon:yes gene_type:complete